MENRITTRINGTCVHAGECHRREENMHARLEVLVEEIRHINAAGL
jgi:hypothetical protein